MSQPEHLGRKRSRSKCDDGVCDFMPLSKRINNLHLDRPTAGVNGQFGQPIPNGGINLEGAAFENGAHWPQESFARQDTRGFPNEQQAQQGPQQNSPLNVNHTAAGSTWESEQMMAQYTPILDQTENPHYYESNKMLFELFMERLQRIPPL
ncbi:hypothetical protein B566_EDAN009446 [Ephemera danica]|nr:hypothetical protein B566_EDAN009446 [Ephemera danica]